MRYEFQFDSNGPYGHLVDLITEHVPVGVVIDLGCGHAAIAGPLRELGFQYVGAEMDDATIDALHARGVEVHRVDLTATSSLSDSLVALAAGRAITAITALDVVEHLPQPVATLRAVHDAMARLGTEWLGLSIPNVAHVDLAAKLLAGRWDVTPTGLLDDTHVSLFTEARVRHDLAVAGFAAGPAKDFHLEHSDQHYPADLATLSPAAPLARLLRAIRADADAYSTTNQFVRLFRRADVQPPGDPASAATTPSLSVVVRADAAHSGLAETLADLEAQTSTDFEVLKYIVGEGDDRVSVLNQAVDSATGHHLAILDAGRRVLPNWVEEFREALDDAAAVVRSRTVLHRTVPAGDDTVEHTPARLDLVQLLADPLQPVHSFALPMSVFRDLGLRFDPTLANADQLVVLQAAQWCGLTDTEVVTTIHRPDDVQGSPDDATARADLAAHLDRRPLLLPEGSAARLLQALSGAQVAAPADQSIDPLAVARARMATAPDMRTALAGEGVATRTALLLEALAIERDRADRAEAEVAAFERSRVWRATKPVRVVLQAESVRRTGAKVLGRLRRR